MIFRTSSGGAAVGWSVLAALLLAGPGSVAGERLVLARDGEPLASFGTARAPLRVPVTDDGDGGRVSIARRWWFWTIIGVVVAGVAVGVTLALVLPDDGPSGQNAILNVSVCDPETEPCP